MTRDIDIVLEATSAEYESLIRPTFEADFLENDPIDPGGRWIGELIHREELARVDLMFGRADPWARSAMERRHRLEHPIVGPVWVLTAEDLVRSNGSRGRPSSSFVTFDPSFGSWMRSPGSI